VTPETPWCISGDKIRQYIKMKLDWKIVSLAFLLVFLMAYAVGVAVSGIVDNRMRTALMNMPRPVIKIMAGDTVASQSSTHGLTTDGEYELEHFQDTPATYKGTQIGVQDPRKLEIQVDKQTLEKPLAFKKYPSQYWDNETYRIPNKVVAETRRQYGRRENDPTVASWGSEYDKQRRIWEFQLSQPPYLPSNSEDMEDFAKIEGGTYKDHSDIKTIEPNHKMDADTRVVLAARDSPLVARDHRRADFKCQRLTDNCTMNHHPKVYWQEKGGPKSYDVRAYEQDLEESRARSSTEEMLRLRKEQLVRKLIYRAEQTPVDEEAEEEYDDISEEIEEEDEEDRE
jgi:hypothetical protein